MTLTTPKPPAVRPTAEARFGYLVAIAVNGVLLWVVNRLPDWESPAFLTDDLEQVIPIASLSLIASIVVNVINLATLERVWRIVGEIGSSVVALVATVRIFQVFPFDFSGYAVNWEPLTRLILIVAMIGISIAIIAQSVKLAIAARR